MSVQIDDELCMGNGVCAMRAPDVFSLVGDGPATVLEANPPADRADAVRSAERGCPMQAVVIDGGGEGGVG